MPRRSPAADPTTRTLRSVEAHVRRALHDRCLTAAEQTGGPLIILVAVSGGPDSLALLHALARLRRQRGLPPLALHVAYIDHGLRPAAVTAEETAFVQAEAAWLGLPCTSERADVRALARWEHRSIEDAARRCRYALLGAIAARVGATLVATGHTADDRAETALLRLLRGTGVAGLAVLPYRAPWPLRGGGPTLIRPLLDLTRADTEAYCTALALAPRYDEENANPRYRRNRVRHELLPLLRQLNPRITDGLNALADEAAAVNSLLATTLDLVWPQLAQVTNGQVCLDRAALRRQPQALQAEAVRRALRLLDREGLPPDRRATAAVLGLLAAGSGRSLDLAGATARSDDEAIWLTSLPPLLPDEVRTGAAAHARGGAAPRPAEGASSWPPIVLPLGQAVVYGCWLVSSDGPLPAVIDRADRWTAWLRPEAFEEVVTVGPRRPGERIEPLGMTGSRKLQDVLADAHIPRAERDAVPIVCIGERVAWVAGLRLARWATVRPGELAIRIHVQRAEGPYGDEAG